MSRENDRTRPAGVAAPGSGNEMVANQINGPEHSPEQSKKQRRYRASFIVTDPDGSERRLYLIGRFAQTLEALIDAGHKGMTTQDIGSWAVRNSHYIYRLRGKWRLNISTEVETHGGEYPGKHGRYVLISTVRRAVDSATPVIALWEPAERAPRARAARVAQPAQEAPCGPPESTPPRESADDRQGKLL